MTRRCVYCGAPNATRGRCCCPQHARRISSILSNERATARRRFDKLLTKRAAERARDRAWRDVAMGREPDAALQRLFDLAGMDAPG